MTRWLRLFCPCAFLLSGCCYPSTGYHGACGLDTRLDAGYLDTLWQTFAALGSSLSCCRWREVTAYFFTLLSADVIGTFLPLVSASFQPLSGRCLPALLAADLCFERSCVISCCYEIAGHCMVEAVMAAQMTCCTSARVWARLVPNTNFTRLVAALTGPFCVRRCWFTRLAEVVFHIVDPHVSTAWLRSTLPSLSALHLAVSVTVWGTSRFHSALSCLPAAFLVLGVLAVITAKLPFFSGPHPSSAPGFG